MLALAHSIMTLMMKLGQNKSYTHTQINKGKALFFCDLLTNINFPIVGGVNVTDQKNMDK